MAWESRNGQGRYYTRSRRSGRRVVREYVGGGRTAEAYARLDRIRREEREEKQALLREERELFEEIDRITAGYFRQVEDVLSMVMEAAGYRRHRRGAWRKRRRNGEEG